MATYLNETELFEKWKAIIDGTSPHASIRIGDGEAAVAAQKKILSMDFIQTVYPWVRANDINYCGVLLPNEDVRRKLVKALQQADFLGILSQTENWMFRPLADMVVKCYHLQPKSWFYAFDNYILSTKKEFYEYFQNKSVLLVGNKAKCLKKVLENRYGWNGIVGTVDCSDWRFLEIAEAEMNQYFYRVALVSAGVPGKILTAHAKAAGNVGIDFGCGADLCLEADAAGLYAWEMKTGPKRNFVCE